MAITMREELLPAIQSTGLTMSLTTSVLCRPAPMMITAMIEMTALLLRLEKASFGVTSPINTPKYTNSP